MKVKVLGTRGQIKPSGPRHSRHSGLLIDGVLMLDFGEKEYLDYRPLWIFITHLHPDHAVFIHEPVQTDIPVYAPEMDAGGIVTALIEQPVTIGPYTVTPIPVHHSAKVRSVAYRVSDGKHALLYTGDMIRIDKQFHPLFEGVDMVITEASYLNEGGRIIRDKKTGQLYGHTGAPDLIRLFKDFTRHILLVHFGSWFYKDMKKARQDLLRLGRENDVNIHIGHDGMKLDMAILKG